MRVAGRNVRFRMLTDKPIAVNFIMSGSRKKHIGVGSISLTGWLDG